MIDRLISIYYSWNCSDLIKCDRVFYTLQGRLSMFTRKTTTTTTTQNRPSRKPMTNLLLVVTNQ